MCCRKLYVHSVILVCVYAPVSTLVLKLDETPPVLDCPQNVEVIADEVSDMTEVFWTAPVPVDNSGFRPVLTSEPAVTPGSRFPIGTTYVTYKAEDLNQNVAKCKFFIRVIGEYMISFTFISTIR